MRGRVLASTVVVSLAGVLWYPHDPLPIAVCVSLLAGVITWYLLPLVGPRFIAAGLSGRDMCKSDRPLLPESTGILAATIYLMCMLCFSPFLFHHWFIPTTAEFPLRTFPFQKLGEYLAALLCLQSMVFLGFADDVFDIRWRYKLLMPTIASIPLLMGYFLSDGVTHMVVPIPLRDFLGRVIDIGVLYYVYIAMVAIFCTNAINILAGVNGVEAGQSLIIAMSIAANDFLYINGVDRFAAEVHIFSLYFMLPFIAVTAALLWHNWTPARVFVGDTYCYFAGMTFAVVGIIGHFSKTMLLFFIPQVFNFVYSSPQLFHLVPCPRHRMPTLNNTTGKLEPSQCKLTDCSTLGWAIVYIYQLFGLAELRQDPSTGVTTITNLTLLNFILTKCGPLHEATLVSAVLGLQVVGSLLAFFIRYQLVHFFY
ncbi:tunicamycin resistance protein [Dispira simplex]|nr:tunicamycin resistance protein [Dispira simplex]